MNDSESTSKLPIKHGVCAVLSDGDGRLLFIRRGLTIPRAPGFWCFVGGVVEAGESHTDAIVREVMEEVGLQVQALEKIHETFSPDHEFRLHWMKVQLTHTSQNLRLHEIEVADARWLSMKEALSLDPILPALKLWLLDQLR